MGHPSFTNITYPTLAQLQQCQGHFAELGIRPSTASLSCPSFTWQIDVEDSTQHVVF